MTDTPRFYPRTLRDAFPFDYSESALGIEDMPPVIPTRPPLWVRVLRWIFRL